MNLTSYTTNNYTLIVALKGPDKNFIPNKIVQNTKAK